MASPVQVAQGVKDAVNARIDREIQKSQVVLDEKRARLDELVAVEDGGDREQHAEIARLQAEVAGQQEAIGAFEAIKSGVNADLNGDGGMVAPDPEDFDIEEFDEPDPTMTDM